VILRAINNKLLELQGNVRLEPHNALGASKENACHQIPPEEIGLACCIHVCRKRNKHRVARQQNQAVARFEFESIALRPNFFKQTKKFEKPNIRTVSSEQTNAVAPIRTKTNSPCVEDTSGMSGNMLKCKKSGSPLHLPHETGSKAIYSST
jgi:hypothetical protein